MTFVEEQDQVIALYNQNELHQVAPGNEAEFTLNDAARAASSRRKVDSIVWAQGQGQVADSAQLPTTGFGAGAARTLRRSSSTSPRGTATVPAAGAVGHAAIYTEHGDAIHILRKVILRVGVEPQLPGPEAALTP